MKKFPSELIFWAGALVYLSCINPAAEHMSLCIFHWLGISWCPGCGIGHSISYALHGNWSEAWQAHFMGIPAIAIISFRITQLLQQYFRNRHLIQQNNPTNQPL